MNNYNEQFYDLLTRALGGNDSVRLQGFLDEVLAEKYNSLMIDGFAFRDEMQLDFTYEQVQKEFGINAMATYTDVDSPATPFATEGAVISTGSIPRMKAVEYWNEDKYRKMLIAEQRFGAGSDRVMNAAIKGLFNTTDKLIGAHTNSLTYQRNQMVSAGKFELTDSNNPRGIKSVTFTAHVPAANKTTLTGAALWYTDNTYATEGASSNPVNDLKAIVKKAKNKGIRGHFEINDTFLDTVLTHSKVAEAIKEAFTLRLGQAVSSVGVSYISKESRVAVLGEILGAPIKGIDQQVCVEKYNKTTNQIDKSTFDSFNADVVVFVPDGQIGEILTVEPLKIAGGTYGEFYGGRLLLTVGLDAVKKCQSFNTEMTSLVVPDKPQGMYYIFPIGA